MHSCHYIPSEYHVSPLTPWYVIVLQPLQTGWHLYAEVWVFSSPQGVPRVASFHLGGRRPAPVPAYQSWPSTTVAGLHWLQNWCIWGCHALTFADQASHSLKLPALGLHLEGTAEERYFIISWREICPLQYAHHSMLVQQVQLKHSLCTLRSWMPGLSCGSHSLWFQCLYCM